MSDVTDKPFEDQFKWKTLVAARVWRPKAGDSICGYYQGRLLRTGQYGDYEVAVVDTPEHGLLTISGSVLISTLDVNHVPEGQNVRITFIERVQVAKTDRWWKKFKVEVAE